MLTGELRNRICIQQQSLGAPSAASNEQLPEWTPWFNLFANIQPLRAEEMAFAKSYASVADHRITIRYNRDIEMADPVTIRAVEGSPTRRKLFHITGMLNGELNNRDNDFRNVWLTLFCTRVIDPAAFPVQTAGVVVVDA